MQIPSSQWTRLIQTGAAEMGVVLESWQIEQCARHAVELLRWAEKINMTTITDPVDMAVKHYLDSFAPARWMSETAASLLDIGTGGGFPGIPLKILLPAIPMTLMDASRKKISFLKHVIRILGLDQIEAVQGRAEEFSEMGRFDLIVSRAVSDINHLLDLARPMLAPHGRIIGFLGGKPDDQTVYRQDDRYSVEFKPYVLPVLDLHRTLVFIRKR